MTDWEHRLHLKLAHNREFAEAKREIDGKRCIACKRQFRRTEPTCWTERRGPGREGPYCYECWEES